MVLDDELTDGVAVEVHPIRERDLERGSKALEDGVSGSASTVFVADRLG